MKLREPMTALRFVPPETPPPPELDKPELLQMANGYKLLIAPGINPSKMRKGKSGELPRGGGKR